MASIGSKHVDAQNAMLVLQMIPRVGSTDGRTQLALGRELWASGYDPTGEEYFTTYEAGYTVEVTWSPGFTSTGPINRFMIGMLVAELEFQIGSIHQAIAIVGELPLNSATRSYRAYLLGQIGEWDAIISLAESQVLNENEMDTLTFIMRGIAVRETGQPLVANVYFQAALAKRSHRTWVRTIGYMERAKSYFAAGKKPMARKDLERVLAAEPNHPEALALMSKLEITPS